MFVSAKAYDVLVERVADLTELVRYERARAERLEAALLDAVKPAKPVALAPDLTPPKLDALYQTAASIAGEDRMLLRVLQQRARLLYAKRGDAPVDQLVRALTFAEDVPAPEMDVVAS